MFSHLPYDAQVGLLVHELAHAADFRNKNIRQMIHVALIQVCPFILCTG